MWTDTISAWQHSQDLATLLCVYLKAKAAEPRPHLLASLVAMNAHIIPLNPCKPRAASCAKNWETLPLTKTFTRLRNSLCDDQFFHGNFAQLHSAEESSQPSVVTHTSLFLYSPSVTAFYYSSHTFPVILGCLIMSSLSVTVFMIVCAQGLNSLKGLHCFCRFTKHLSGRVFDDI